jgi:hypothetical protein
VRKNDDIIFDQTSVTLEFSSTNQSSKGTYYFNGFDAPPYHGKELQEREIKSVDFASK